MYMHGLTPYLHNCPKHALDGIGFRAIILKGGHLGPELLGYKHMCVVLVHGIESHVWEEVRLQGIARAHSTVYMDIASDVKLRGS